MWFVSSSKLQSGFVLELLLVWLLVCFLLLLLLLVVVCFFVGGQRAKHPRGPVLSAGLFCQLEVFFGS